MDKGFFGHPIGLRTLFLTEMWERMSYYGMRALLVLYMTGAMTGFNPGLGWSAVEANAIYGIYVGFVYFMVVPGGWIADNILGHQKAVLIDKNYESGMEPNCLKNELPSNNLYIDSEGDFYPCCWMGTYRYKYKSVFSPKQKQFNIKDNTLNQIMENKSIKEFFASTKQFTSAHECCKIQCGVKHG